MIQPVRLGVVGAGAISQRGILPHLSQADVADRVILQAVCDPAPGRAEDAAARWGVRRAYGSLDELLAHGDVDAVTIASPIGLHFEQGRQAIEAGVHVHFNKTMTTTVAEADELIELARNRKVHLVASPGEVLRPQLHYLREQLEAGAIGELVWVLCGSALERYHENEEFRSGSDPLSSVDPSWYFRKPGGGPLYDMTVYQLHMITVVLGPVQRVTAMSGTRIAEREWQGRAIPTDVHDNTLILLDFGRSRFALAYGTAAGSPSGWYPTYYGTRGIISGWEINGKPLQFPGRELADQAPGWDGEQFLLPHVVGPHRTIEEQHVFEDIMQLVDWVREDRPSQVTAERARHVIEIIEAAYRAAETGQTQQLKTTF